MVGGVSRCVHYVATPYCAHMSWRCGVQREGATWVTAKRDLATLWPYTNKFGKWPVGAHVIRFATEVYKHSTATSSHMLS